MRSVLLRDQKLFERKKHYKALCRKMKRAQSQLSTFPKKDGLISQVDELKNKLENKEKENATMRQSLKILEEERIVLKMKSVTNANKKDISSYIGKTSIP
jgi:hypothetical protein